jgi:hypothetical protein
MAKPEVKKAFAPKDQVEVKVKRVKIKTKKQLNNAGILLRAKVGVVNNPLTVTVGASATIRVGDHEFIRPEIIFHNLDPKISLDKQMKAAIKVVDKAWPVVIKQMNLKVEGFKDQEQQ